MDVTAVCERSGDWWAVTVPEVEGGFTQTRRLDSVPGMVADLVSLATGVSEDDVSVTIEISRNLESLTHSIQEWRGATEQAEQARELQDFAARRARAAVTELRSAGLSVRDVGTLLDVSPQRVSQLINS
jgi:DNA-directed RNA polymerase specialized sigma subunit